MKNALSDQVGSPLNLGMAGLRIAHDNAGIERLTLNDLHAALEEADLPIKKEALKKAVAASGNRVTRKKVGRDVLYRLTILGRALADEVLATGDLDLVYIDGTTPRTDAARSGMFWVTSRERSEHATRTTACGRWIVSSFCQSPRQFAFSRHEPARAQRSGPTRSRISRRSVRMWRFAWRRTPAICTIATF